MLCRERATRCSTALILVFIGMMTGCTGKSGAGWASGRALQRCGAREELSSFDRGADGTIWVVDSPDDQIVAIDPHGRATRYAVPTPNAGPTAINVDERGDAWFLEHDGKSSDVPRQTAR